MKLKKLTIVLQYLRPYWLQAILNIFFNILSVIFSVFSVSMAIPFLGILFNNQPPVESVEPFHLSVESIKQHFYYFISQMIEQYGEETALLYVSLFIVAASFFRTGFRYFAMFNLAPIRNGVVKDVRNRLYSKILRLPIGYYSEERKGDIIARMTNDVQEIEISIISSLEMFLRDPLTIVIYLSWLLFMSPNLTLFVFILLPISGYLIGRIGKSLKKKSRIAQTKMGFLLSLIEETLGGLRIIKAFNAEKKVRERFFGENKSYTKVMISMFRRRYLSNPLSEFLGTAVMVIIMWYGASLVLSNTGSLSSQALIGYLMMFYLIIAPAKSFSTAYYNLQKGMASAERINKILEAKVKIEEKPDAKPIDTFAKAIEYRNVSFRYETELVLKNIHITIKKGKTIALVGQSGSGKSTFVDLLPRFYDATEGGIFIDDIPITEYKIENLRHLMGNVNQESILFNDTIYNNISFGVKNATKEDVIRAAKVANAHDFIMHTTEGYDTNIGDRGSKLSGGQRQRISIARAVLKNPPIMILDEATSALDTESERLVQDALTKLMENRTSIVIAHRLSTVKYVDEICVLHEGEIVERGTHDELMKTAGMYRKLHDLQMFE